MVKRIVFALFFYFPAMNIMAQNMVNQKVLLPNGWSLTPAGSPLSLGGDLPLNMDISHSGKYLVVTNNGQSDQSIQLIDAKSQKLLFTKIIPKSWLGIKFSKNEKYIYASGGNDNCIWKYAIRGDTLALADSIGLGKKWPVKISPTGVELDDNKYILYVVTKENNSLYAIDLKTKKITKQIRLSAEAYTCLLSANGKYLYISLWGGAKVLVYDTKTEKLTDSFAVGRNPNDICISRNNKYLYVANSLDNSVSVIDLEKKKVVETLNAALYPNAPQGSTTNSVALSEDDKTLYIANADNNCLAVFDMGTPGASKSKGFIPVGWYPTCVRLFGHTLYVANGKGFTSLPNPKGPQPVRKGIQSTYKRGEKKNVQYIGSLFKGSISIIAEPDAAMLSEYSRKAYENTQYTKEKEMNAEGEAGNPIPMKTGGGSPIKHVFYIIKENRTYDQVLADMHGGNGDTNLLLFGEKITPNQHAVAKQFVLLDNFYVDAEVSADGHNWSMAAYANDYVEKTWPTHYGGRGGTFDYQGTRKIAYPRDGFIWDYAMRAGVTIRNYGEFLEDSTIPPLPNLANHTCKRYPGWNLDIQDIYREKIWEHDFDSLQSINAVAQLNIVYFPNDHTSGLRKGALTPFAQVADNDEAVGRFIDHLSKSPLWENSVVFILEDDAQNGPDHVDAHRSPAYIAGGYVKRGYVDHSMYSTSGMLRTMELILGLPPMSQYDAAATPMYKCFSAKRDTTSYMHIEPKTDLDAKNTAMNKLSKESGAFDLSEADKVPDFKLNEVLWKAIKGENTVVPAPQRAAFVKTQPKKDDD